MYNFSNRSFSNQSAGFSADHQQQQQQAADPISLPTFYALGNNYNSETLLTSSQLPFNVVNLRYDLTPIGNISVVATETGLTPPTSIPVLMREMQQSQQQQQQQQQLQHVHVGNSGTSGSTGMNSLCILYQ